VWVQERGFELPTQPEGESCPVRWLCLAALLREANPPARVAAGQSHSLFIDGEGRLSSCGNAENWMPGLLGHGEGVTRLNTPTRLPSTLGRGERAVSVSAGDYHSLALTSGGAVCSWGDGGYGALGHGDRQDQWQPKKVEELTGQRVVAVCSGRAHSLAQGAQTHRSLTDKKARSDRSSSDFFVSTYTRQTLDPTHPHRLRAWCVSSRAAGQIRFSPLLPLPTT